MKKLLCLLVVVAWLLPSLALAAPNIVAAKGLLCWMPVPAVSLTGYRMAYQTVSGQPVAGSTIDVGLVTSAPTPPAGVTPCPPGEVGIARDNSALPNGIYYAEVAAYNVLGSPAYAETSYQLVSQLPPVISTCDVH